MRRFALFVNFGPEIRTFANTALGHYLDGAVVFCRYQDSSYLQGYAVEYNFTIVTLAQEHWQSPQLKSQSQHYSSVKSRAMLKGETLFSYGKVTKEITIKDRIKGLAPVVQYFAKKFRSQSSKIDLSDLVEVFHEHKITDLLLGEYGWSVFKFSRAGHLAGCRNWAFVHSWKDVCISSYIYAEVDGVFTWNEAMACKLRRDNSHVRPEKIYACGYPRLTDFFGTNQTNTKSAVPLSAGYLLYTCIHPKSYAREPELVMQIIAYLRDSMGQDFPGMVIKTNPMDTKPQRWRQLNDKDICVVESDWEWDETAFFNLPSLESERQWPPLLKQSSIVMGVASTVSLEALASQKPVINIAFNCENEAEMTFADLAHSPFYRSLLNKPAVALAHSIEELGQLVSQKQPADFDIEDIVRQWDATLFEEVVGR